MIEKIMKIFVELNGNRIVSNVISKFSKSKFSKFLIIPFVYIYKVNTKESKRNLNEFKSIHDLFTRELKSKARAIDGQEKSIVSPVDGKITDFGYVKNRNVLSIKKNNFLIDELLGSSMKSQLYDEGIYIVIYLSPHNYHRIHGHITGTVINSYSLGLKSYPVNNLGLKYGKRPLSTNFRLVTELQNKYGLTSIIKIGALNINSIQLTYTSTYINKGDEIGYFSFGSTVVLLFNNLTLDNLYIELKQEVKMGEIIGSY